MDELLINYGISKSKKITNIIFGCYLAIFCLFFIISEGVAERFSILFFCSLVGFILSVIVLLGNTLWLPGPSLKIDINTIESNPKGKSGLKIDWAKVSSVNIGISYINFSVNGGLKEQKLDLAYLTYDDLKNAKSKIIEGCEYKNIAYKND